MVSCHLYSGAVSVPGWLSPAFACSQKHRPHDIRCIRVARAEEGSCHCSQATSVPFSKHCWDSPKPRLRKTCWAFPHATICHPNVENSWILIKESAAWVNHFQRSSVTQMSWEKQMAFTLRHLGEPQTPHKVSKNIAAGPSSNNYLGSNTILYVMQSCMD